MAKRQTLTDASPFPWGKHKGTPMKKVPADYLVWCYDQKWIREWPDLNDYLVANIKVIESELPDEEDEPRGEFQSYEDYRKHGRR